MSKKLILILIATSIGTIVTNLLENVINVWIARGSGLLVAVVVVLVLYQQFVTDKDEK